MEQIKIETEYIKLDQFLKLTALVQTGGEAKILISNGEVLVNDEICLQRGKKLRIDDIVEISGYEKFLVI